MVLSTWILFLASIAMNLSSGPLLRENRISEGWTHMGGENRKNAHDTEGCMDCCRTYFDGDFWREGTDSSFERLEVGILIRKYAEYTRFHA
jgi:hypothetical protein